MKLLIFTIPSIIFFMALSPSNTESIAPCNTKDQSSVLKIDGLGCIDCHGSPDAHGGFTQDFYVNYEPSIIVHQEESPKLIKGLETFLATHTSQTAMLKQVDYQKVANYVADF